METNQVKEDDSTSKGETEQSTQAGCPADSDMAGKADVCQGCPGQVLCRQLGGIDPDQEMINLRMNAIKHKILVLSGKGGVGKSSVAASLTVALAEKGFKCGICDLDICGPSIPLYLNVADKQVINTLYGWQPLQSPYHDVKVMSVGALLQNQESAVIWRGPRKTGLIKRFLKDTFWGRLDYLIFDTPPGTSDEHLTIVKALKSVNPDGALIITTPQDISLVTVRKEICFCKKMGIRILGVVENMSTFQCPCCKDKFALFVNQGTEQLCNDFKLPHLGRIPVDKNLAETLEMGNILKIESTAMAVIRGIIEKLT